MGIIQKLTRVESIWALWNLVKDEWLRLLVGGGVMTAGGITAWLSTGVEWINQFGAFGWWTAGLVGALIALAILASAAWLRYAWVAGSAVHKWKAQVDTINPLDPEFQRRRIRVSDLSHPVTQRNRGLRGVHPRAHRRGDPGAPSGLRLLGNRG